MRIGMGWIGQTDLSPDSMIGPPTIGGDLGLTEIAAATGQLNTPAVPLANTSLQTTAEYNLGQTVSNAASSSVGLYLGIAAVGVIAVLMFAKK